MAQVGFDRSPLEVAQGMAEGNMHIASKFVDVISGQSRADVSMLSFRGPDSFVVGNNLQNHFPAWELIANIAPFDLTSKILLWIKNCVDVNDFFQPYRGGRGCWSSPFSFGYEVYVMTTGFSICVEGHAMLAWFPFTAFSNVKKTKYYSQFTILSSRMYKEKESTWK